MSKRIRDNQLDNYLNNEDDYYNPPKRKKVKRFKDPEEGKKQVKKEKQ